MSIAVMQFGKYDCFSKPLAISSHHSSVKEGKQECFIIHHIASQM
jgi:hypothetical protein